MQVKYLSALKTKYASFGLSKEALDRVASQRIKTIANEEEIDNDIASSEVALLIMKEMQGAADALRNNNARIQKELDSLKTDSNKQTQQDDINPYAATLAEMKEFMQSMRNEFAESQKKARKEAVIAQAHEVMKKNGCTNDFIRNTTLKGVEIGDSDTAESIAEKYKSVYDQNCKDAFGESYVPPKGNNYGGDAANDKDAETAILKKAGLL